MYMFSSIGLYGLVTMTGCLILITVRSFIPASEMDNLG